MPRKGLRRVAKTRRLRKVGKKQVARIAKRVVNSMSETKYLRTAVNNGQLYGDPADLTYQNNFMEVASTLGSITQGTGQGNRIGNRIRLTRCTMNIMLNGLDNAVPRLVMMYLVSDRRNPTDANAADLQDACNGLSGAGGILQDGNTSIGFQKRHTDIMQRINEDRFMFFFKRVFKIGRAGAPTGTTSAGNNDFSYLRRIKVNLLKYMPKVFRYSDASTVPAFQRRLFVCFHVVAADGTVLAAASPACNISYAYDIKFKDI